MYESFLNNYESSMTMRGGEGRRRGGVKKGGVGREGEGLSPRTKILATALPRWLPQGK